MAYDAIPFSLGVIVSADGYRYQITREDVLWLARSVQYEGGNHLATAWTYAQRQVLFRRMGSLAALVQAHSQPVNPIWRRDGEKCRPGGPYHGRDQCSEARLARRDEAANLPWSEISEEIRQVVTLWALGRTDNPVPRATDFADPTVSQNFLDNPRHAGSRVVLRDGNWYIAEVTGTKDATRWPADFVTIEPPRAGALISTALANVTGGLLWRALGVTAALGGLAAFFVYRARRSRGRR